MRELIPAPIYRERERGKERESGGERESAREREREREREYRLGFIGLTKSLALLWLCLGSVIQTKYLLLSLYVVYIWCMNIFIIPPSGDQKINIKIHILLDDNILC